MQGNRTLHHNTYNLTILHAFNLGVLGVLGASLFPAPEMGSRQGRQARQATQGLEGGRFFEAVDEALPVSLQVFVATMDQLAEL